MSQTYQICEVTVTLPSLGTITTDGSGNQIKHGDKCRVHLYAVKPDRHPGTIFDGFNVGAITFTGYTDSPFKRSQKIMVPDGYKLVALRVDDDGVPTSWDSLPVHFTGGFIESPIDEPRDGINSYCPIEDFKWGWFVDKSGQAYIHEALIGDGGLSTGYNVKLNINNDGKEHAAGMAVGVEEGKQQVTFKTDRYKVQEAVSSIIENAMVSTTRVTIKLGDEMMQAVIDAVRESDLFASLQAKIDAQTASVAGLQQAVNEAVNDALRNALKPGGILWAAISHR